MRTIIKYVICIFDLSILIFLVKQGYDITSFLFKNNSMFSYDFFYIFSSLNFFILILLIILIIYNSIRSFYPSINNANILAKYRILFAICFTFFIISLGYLGDDFYSINNVLGNNQSNYVNWILLGVSWIHAFQAFLKISTHHITSNT